MIEDNDLSRAIATIRLELCGRSESEIRNDAIAQDRKGSGRDARDYFDSFVDRIVVNYLRHECTPYDELVLKLDNRPDKALLLEQLRDNVFTLIRRQFPSLRAECERQQEARTLITETQTPTEREAAVRILSVIREAGSSVTDSIWWLSSDDVVAYLQELQQFDSHGASRLVRYIGEGQSQSVVDDWRERRQSPQNPDKLTLCLELSLILATRFPPRPIYNWFSTPNLRLARRRPMELIRSHDVSIVRDALYEAAMKAGTPDSELPPIEVPRRPRVRAPSVKVAAKPAKRAQARTTVKASVRIAAKRLPAKPAKRTQAKTAAKATLKADAQQPQAKAAKRGQGKTSAKASVKTGAERPPAKAAKRAKGKTGAKRSPAKAAKRPQGKTSAKRSPVKAAKRAKGKTGAKRSPAKAAKRPQGKTAAKARVKTGAKRPQVKAAKRALTKTHKR